MEAHQIKSKSKEVSLAFATVVLEMSGEILPDLSDCNPQVLDQFSLSEEQWVKRYVEVQLGLVQSRLSAHPVTAYLLEQGFSVSDLWDFINQVRARELQNAIRIFNEETMS